MATKQVATSVQPAARGPAPVDYARRTAALTPVLWLLFGCGLGAAAAVLYAAAPGRLLLAAGAAGALATLALRPAVLRSARVATAVGTATFAFVALSFAALSAAAAHGAFGPAAAVLLFAGAALALALGTRQYGPRRAAEWERERVHNTTRALDLERATYAFGADRGFRYKPARAEGGPAAALWPWVGATSAYAAGLPVLLGGAGGADPRAYVVLLFGAPVCVCFAPLLATGVSNYRRLAAYERELGRDITNG
jgi:hypothetical protein